MALPVRAIDAGWCPRRSLASLELRYFLSVRTADLTTLPADAVIVTFKVNLTPTVAIGTLADEEPAGTVTSETVAKDGSELVSVTRNPPAGAGPLSVTLALDAAPPLTLLGISERLVSTGGSTLIERVAVVPPYDAVIFAGVDADTADVAITKVFDVLPF